MCKRAPQIAYTQSVGYGIAPQQTLHKSDSPFPPGPSRVYKLWTFLWKCRRIPSRRSRSRRALPEWVKETYSGASLHYRRLSLRSAQSLRCSLTLRASTISPIEKPQLQRTSARGEHCGETHKGTTTLSAIREACLGSLTPHKLWENSGYVQLIVSSESGWQNGQVSVSVLQEHRSSGKRCIEGRCRCQSAYPRCRGDCRILGGPPRGQSVQRGTKLKPHQDDSVFLRCGSKNLHFSSYLRKKQVDKPKLYLWFETMKIIII